MDTEVKEITEVTPEEEKPVKATKAEKKPDPVKELKKQLKEANAKIDALTADNQRLTDLTEALKKRCADMETQFSNICNKFSKDTKFIADTTRVLYTTVMRTLKEVE